MKIENLQMKWITLKKKTHIFKKKIDFHLRETFLNIGQLLICLPTKMDNTRFSLKGWHWCCQGRKQWRRGCRQVERGCEGLANVNLHIHSHLHFS